MDRIGMVTIGQSPRDDMIPAMRAHLATPVEVVEKGALDGLSREEIAALGPDPDEVGMVSRLRDGSPVMLSYNRVLPRMQTMVDRLVEEGCQFVVVVCGADWSDLRSSRLIVNPGRVFPAVVTALARGRRLGIIKPTAGQVEKERERYTGLGIDVVVTWAPPYAGAARLEATRESAAFLRSRDVDLVWMSCMGMDEEMRAAAREVVGRPVLLARSLLARVVDELLAGA